jgi:hypothetical protein
MARDAPGGAATRMSTQRGDDSRLDVSENMIDMRHISVRVSDELFARVKDLADADRRTLQAWLTIQLERIVAEEQPKPQRRKPEK